MHTTGQTTFIFKWCIVKLLNKWREIMSSIKDYPELQRWISDKVETVCDSVCHPWDVVGLEDVENKLLEMQSQIDFKIEECQELARACNRYKQELIKRKNNHVN